MAHKSVESRLKITKNEKVLHRTKGLGHCKSTKNMKQRMRKKGTRELGIALTKVKEILKRK